MKAFIFLFVSVFFISPSFSQNFLELKNTQTGKTRVLKPGAKLLFKSNRDDDFIKGKIVQIKDTSVVIYCTEYDEELSLMDVNINNFTVIKKPTLFHSIWRTSGSVFTPVGGYLFLNGLFSLIRDNDQKSYTKDQAVAYTATGFALTAIGLAPFFIKPKAYDLKKDWTLSVKKQAGN
jgi:hypothetical protein